MNKSAKKYASTGYALAKASHASSYLYADPSGLSDVQSNKAR